jgi:hypothetical protein
MDTQAMELLIPLTAIVMGTLTILIPIAAFSVRYAIKPIMDAIRSAREGSAGGTAREVAVLEQRVALLEQQYLVLEGEMGRIGEVKEFERRLAATTDLSKA